jgi:hypothetical protein
MLPNGPLDAIPLWGIFLLTGALVLGAVEVGYRLGARRHRRAADEQAGAVGTMVASTLGLLAFILAFVFNFAAVRVDARRTALMDEANAIGTTYLRADYLPEAHRSEVRRLLRDDVDAQLDGVKTLRMAETIQRVDAIHAELWQHATALGRDNPESETISIFIESLNTAIDNYAKRLMTVRTRVSAPIWFSLYLLTFMAMSAMGYHIALTGTSRSPTVMTVALSFALVICLVADLDRPHEGFMTLSQRPMVDLQTMMQSDASR